MSEVIDSVRTMSLTPFVISVSDEVLADLRARLDRSRALPDSPRRPAAGIDAATRARLVAEWASFDWRVRERELNAWPHYLAAVDDTTIHVVHRPAPDPDAPAILIMHGWPHTFQLQLRFAELLPDFHVVVPSLPGFAFSPPYADRRFSSEAVAQTMHRLMTETLGYDAFLTYGEDVSAEINDLLASRYVESVRGVIATHGHFPSTDERAVLTAPDEIAFFDRLAADRADGGGYAHVQSTRPDTVAAALNDSPAGLAAWIVEKLYEWSDGDADALDSVRGSIPLCDVLTELTIYWATQSIATSFRPYAEGDDAGPMEPTPVPAAVIVQRHEHDYPESLARRFYRDLRLFERLPAGGHFTVAEVPAEMATRVRRFARSLGFRVASDRDDAA